MATSEDYRKYLLALGSRSVRRVAAKVCAASGLDADVRSALMKELTQAMTWQRIAVLTGQSQNDRATYDTDSDEYEVEIDLATYSNGQPVFTVVDWLDGYATIVHHPDSQQTQGEDEGELAAEVCPCCGGMPSAGRLADDDGNLGVPNTK